MLAFYLTKRRQAEEILSATLEQRIRERTKELEAQQRELEQFNHMAVDRETQMIALKRQVNALARTLGKPPVYDLSFVDGVSSTASGAVR